MQIARQQIARDDGAEDAHDDVADQPEAAAFINYSGKPACDRADHEHDDDCCWIDALLPSFVFRNSAQINARTGKRSVRGYAPPLSREQSDWRGAWRGGRSCAHPVGGGAGKRPSCSSIESRSNIKLNETCLPSRKRST